MLAALRALAILVSIAALAAGPTITPAAAGHCGTVEAARDPERCAHTPPPTPRPTPTPVVTPAPTQQNTPSPTRRPATATPRTTRRPTTGGTTTTPEPTPVFLDPTPLVTLEPTFTPQILVDTPAPEPTPTVDPEPAGSSSPAGWAWLFVGLLIGALGGRMSWGLSRRRKKQQIFG